MGGALASVFNWYVPENQLKPGDYDVYVRGTPDQQALIALRHARHECYIQGTRRKELNIAVLGPTGTGKTATINTGYTALQPTHYPRPANVGLTRPRTDANNGEVNETVELQWYYPRCGQNICLWDMYGINPQSADAYADVIDALAEGTLKWKVDLGPYGNQDAPRFGSPRFFPQVIVFVFKLCSKKDGAGHFAVEPTVANRDLLHLVSLVRRATERHGNVLFVAGTCADLVDGLDHGSPERANVVRTIAQTRKAICEAAGITTEQMDPNGGDTRYFELRNYTDMDVGTGGAAGDQRIFSRERPVMQLLCRAMFHADTVRRTVGNESELRTRLSQMSQI